MNDYKNDFPLLKDSNIIYLDSGATSQKPLCVIDAEDEFYKKYNANPYRGAYDLSVKATSKYNEARHEVAKFLSSKYDEEIIFRKNATEALNLIAYTYGLDNLQQNDKVVLSIMEHHSNLVPWQKISKQKNAKLEYMYINKNFELDKEEIDKKITKGTKVLRI